MAAKTTLASLISRTGLKRLAGKRYFERGLAYFHAGTVAHLGSGEDGISARVVGTQPYAVRLWSKGRQLRWGCTCPLGIDGEFCKHLVATGLAWLSGGFDNDGPENTPELQAIRAFVETIDKHALMALLIERAAWDEDLVAELLLAAQAYQDTGNHTQREERGGFNKAKNSGARKRPK